MRADAGGGGACGISRAVPCVSACVGAGAQREGGTPLQVALAVGGNVQRLAQTRLHKETHGQTHKHAAGVGTALGISTARLLDETELCGTNTHVCMYKCKQESKCGAGGGENERNQLPYTFAVMKNPSPRFTLVLIDDKFVS
jgi:hypothetical protein